MLEDSEKALTKVRGMTRGVRGKIGKKLFGFQPKSETLLTAATQKQENTEENKHTPLSPRKS